VDPNKASCNERAGQLPQWSSQYHLGQFCVAFWKTTLPPSTSLFSSQTMLAYAYLGRACAQRYKQICIGCTYAVCLYEHACTCAYMSMHTCVPTCVLCLQGHVCMRECTCLCASSMLVLILPGGVQYCSRLPSEVCKAHEMQTEEHCFFSSVCIKCSAPFEGLGRRKGSTCSRP